MLETQTVPLCSIWYLLDLHYFVLCKIGNKCDKFNNLKVSYMLSYELPIWITQWVSESTYIQYYQNLAFNDSRQIRNKIAPCSSAKILNKSIGRIGQWVFFHEVKPSWHVGYYCTHLGSYLPVPAWKKLFYEVTDSQHAHARESRNEMGIQYKVCQVYCSAKKKWKQRSLALDSLLLPHPDLPILPTAIFLLGKTPSRLILLLAKLRDFTAS